MKKLHYIVVGSLLITCIISACASRGGKDAPEKSGSRRQVLSDKKGIEVSPTPSVLPTAPSYLIRLENETLTLYEITDDEAVSLKTVNIDPSYYPGEDIKELNKGISAYSKEDGYLRLENFVN